MRCELISIGDELLIGQTVNTNASWLGEQLSLAGIPVMKVITIQDEREAILNAIEQGFINSDLIIMTGGLGPTQDDITKQVLCEYFETGLVINERVLEQVRQFFEQRKRPMLEVNRLQAAVPESCIVVENRNGTAPGMGFERAGKILISLPGVPYEMKSIMKEGLLDRIAAHFQTSSIYYQTICTTGIGESFLAERIKDWESRVRSEGFGLAYLPSPGLLKLRITSDGGIKDQEKIQLYFKELEEQYPEYVFGYGEDTLSEVTGKLLLEHNKTVGTVESCTGGGLGAELVKTAGSSAYFKGGLITYTNELKHQLAGVKSETLKIYDAVSEETVKEMAIGGLKVLETDYCIATSGFVGPSGGNERYGVGTVWISVAFGDSCITRKLNFGSDRENNIQMSIFAALNLLRNVICENNIEKK